MPGPIVRQGVVQLGIEYKMPKIPAIPQFSAPAFAAESAAKTKAAEAAVAVADSLELQRRAEEEVEALQQRAIQTQKEIAQWKSFEEKQARSLAVAVEMEAASKAKAAATGEAVRENSAAVMQENLKAAQAYQKAGIAALEMARGVALLASAGDESFAKMLRHVFVIQGFVDITKGATSVVQQLEKAHRAQAAAAVIAGGASSTSANALATLTAVVNPLTLAMGALGIATISAVKLYDLYTTSAEEAHAAEMNRLQTLRELEAIKSQALLERIEYLTTAAQKEAALAAVMKQRAAVEAAADRAASDARISMAAESIGRADTDLAEQQIGAVMPLLERQRQAAEKALALRKEEAATVKRQNEETIQQIQLRDRELKLARDALQAEEDRERSMRASFGLLDRSDQRKLQRAIAAADAGNATRSNIIDLQRFGGSTGQQIAEHLAAPMGKVMGDALERLAVKVTGRDPEATARSEVQRRQSELDALTKGKTPSTAIHDLEQQNEQTLREMEDFSLKIQDVLTSLSKRIEGMQIQLNRVQSAARNQRG